MKTGMLTFVLVLTFLAVYSQDANVVIFRHDLRWASETMFPNYFLLPDLRDSIFSDTREELMKIIQVNDVKFPALVDYRLINGFGNQKTEMPFSKTGKGPEVGIFSFITRATQGFAKFWKLTLIIRENGITLYSKSVSHELEYYDVSGYLSSRCWLSPVEFREIFGRLIKEAVGTLPLSGEKIILSDPGKKEAMVRSLFPGSQRAFLKIRGSWQTAGNFTALIETENDTLVTVRYKDGWTTELVENFGSGIFPALFTGITGIDVVYDQMVRIEKKGTLQFSDGQETKLRLRWIQMEERSVKNGEGIFRITDPMVTQLFDNEKQSGDFIYTRREKVYTTPETKEKIILGQRVKTENTFGTEYTYRIEGYIQDTTIFAEFNEYHGIIEVSMDSLLLGMVVMQNTNPENRSFGNSRLSENKKWAMSSSSPTGKKSLDNPEKVEWYPVYIPADATEETGKMVIRILSCLFFGMGKQGGASMPEF